MEDLSVFSYKPGSSIIHRMPCWIKILVVPVFNILIFTLDWRLAAAFILIHFIVFCLLKFSPKEQFKDLKPVIYYAVFLYIMNFFIQIYGLYNAAHPSFPELLKTAGTGAITNKETAFFCIKFCACVQSCSLMFKTSTSIEIRTGIEQIETAIRRCIPFAKKEPVFALAVSMLINFIPAIFKMWSQLKKAWFARGGRSGLRMVLVLIPKLFSVGLNYAFNTSKALINRGQR